MLDQPYASLEELLETVGEAGQRLANMHVSEGAAGNIDLTPGGLGQGLSVDELRAVAANFGAEQTLF